MTPQPSTPAAPNAGDLAVPSWTAPMRAAAVVLLAVHAVLAWMLRVPGITTGHDDAWYLVLARAVRQFSYAELPIVGTPPHAMYPPGYPALLAMFGATGPESVSLAVAINVALSVLALVLAARLATRISARCALGLLLVCALNPLLLYQASGVSSEVLYEAATLVALLALTTERSRMRTSLVHVALVAGAVVAALTRSIGVTLLVAMGVELILARRWRSLVQLAVVAGLTVGAWTLWTLRAPRLAAGRSYIADATVVYSAREGDAAATPKAISPSDRAPSTVLRIVRIVTRRVTHHVNGYGRTFLPAAFAVPLIAGTLVDNGIWLLILVVGIGVGFVQLWRRLRPVALYLLVYLGLLVVWPYLMTRYLGPILPLLALSLLLGVHDTVMRLLAWRLAAASRLVAVRAAIGGAAAVAVVLALSGAHQDMSRLGLLAQCDRAAPTMSPGCFGQEQRDFFAGIEAARRLTPDSAHFIGAKDATFHLLSGRQSARESEAITKPDAQQLATFLRDYGVQYILLSRVHIDLAALAGPLGADCTSYELVQQIGAHVALLRVPPPDATKDGVAGARACQAIAAWADGDWTSTNGPLW